MVWTIDVGSFGVNATTNLEFTTFDTVADFDIVEVRDGENNDAPLLGAFSGTIKPKLLLSAGSKLLVRFTSDRAALIQGTGFLAKACTVDPIVHRVTENGTNIQSPNYPSAYTSNLDITWIIDFSQYGSNAAVYLRSIEFKTFDNMDEFTVREGANGDGEILGRFYGEIDIVQLTSTTPIMHVRFTTNCASTAKGFQMVAKKVESGPEYITIDESIISSPGYPTNTPSAVNKTWIIDFTAYGPNVLVHIQCLDFETVDGNAVLEVRDGDLESGLLLGRFSGSDLPPRLTASGTKMRIRFESTVGSDAKGFKAQLTKVDTRKLW